MSSKQRFKGETFYSIDIETSSDGFVTTGTGSIGSSPPCIESALQVAIRDSSYYAITCGYDVRFSITEICDTCSGSGKVPKSRPKFATKVCPDCRGEPDQTIVKRVPFTISDNSIGDLRDGAAEILK